MGADKVIQEFMKTHADVPQRQTRLKIAEIATKEKRGSDKSQRWYLKVGTSRADYQRRSPLISAPCLQDTVENLVKACEVTEAAGGGDGKAEKRKGTGSGGERKKQALAVVEPSNTAPGPAGSSPSGSVVKSASSSPKKRVRKAPSIACPRRAH